jgi:hypothetical protein
MDAFAHVTEIKIIAALLFGCFCFWKSRNHMTDQMNLEHSKLRDGHEFEHFQPVEEVMNVGEENAVKL